MIWRWLVATLVVIVGSIVALVFCVQPYRCNLVKQEATGLTAYAYQRRDTPAGRVAALKTLAVLAPCLRFNCRDVTLDLIAAGNYRALGLHQEALDAYRDALRFDRRPEIFLNRAATEMALGERGRALEDALRACLFNPWMIQGIEDSQLRGEVIDRLIALRPENEEYIRYIDAAPAIPWGT